MIPSRWTDMELWALTYLRSLNSGVIFDNIAPDAFSTKHVLVTAIPGSRATSITRFVRLDLEIRCLKNGEPWPYEENRIANDIAFQLESATRNGNPIVFVELDTGPNRVTDPGGGHEFTEMTVTFEIGRS